MMSAVTRRSMAFVSDEQYKMFEENINTSLFDFENKRKSV
ncbi:hypothetical protein D930_02502 [Enterococcus faecalis KI-6-1-110608-1]|nr:hypothetical protein D930_02502 [Enterococcus faecalis KI-6-1-110608-1]